MESLKKLSDEKLPGMGTRSHSSICSEGHESKKNGKDFLLLCTHFKLTTVYIHLFSVSHYSD